MTNEWSINTFPKVNLSNLIKAFWKLRLFVVFQTLPFPFVMMVVCTFVQGRRYYAKACHSWVQGHECRWTVKVSQLSVPIFNASTGRKSVLGADLIQKFVKSQVERIRARQRDFEERCWEPQTGHFSLGVLCLRFPMIYITMILPRLGCKWSCATIWWDEGGTKGRVMLSHVRLDCPTWSHSVWIDGIQLRPWTSWIMNAGAIWHVHDREGSKTFLAWTADVNLWTGSFIIDDTWLWLYWLASIGPSLDLYIGDSKLWIVREDSCSPAANAAEFHCVSHTLREQAWMQRAEGSCKLS